jgi:hypothetical protein
MVTVPETGESREPSVTFFFNHSSDEPSTTTTGGGIAVSQPLLYNYLSPNMINHERRQRIA